MKECFINERTCNMLAEDGLSDSSKQFPIKQIFKNFNYFNRTLFHLCKCLSSVSLFRELDRPF